MSEGVPARAHRVIVPAYPVFRYLMAGWCAIVAGVALWKDIAPGHAPRGGGVVFALMALVIGGSAWWQGAVVTADALVIRGSWRSRSFPLVNVAGVAAPPRASSDLGRLFIGGYRVVVVRPPGHSLSAARTGLVLPARFQAEDFARRVNVALPAQTRAQP